MSNIVLNERAYAEHAIENNYLGAKPIETVGRVAKYYHSKGYDRAEIISLLEKFIMRCDPNINIVKWQNAIERQARGAEKFKLVEIDEVCITESEINAIEKLESRVVRRLMFTLLCLAKYSNAINPSNNNWVSRSDREAFKLANIQTSVLRQSLMINDLRNSGYVSYSKIIDNININVLIVDDSSPVVLRVSDFRNLGNQYLKFCGEPYIECQSCGIVVKCNSNNQKYCTSCAEETNRQRALLRSKRA